MNQIDDEAADERRRLEAEVERLRGLLEAERAEFVTEMAAGARELQVRDDRLQVQRELVGALRDKVRRLRKRTTGHETRIAELAAELERYRGSRMARTVRRLDDRVRTMRRTP